METQSIKRLYYSISEVSQLVDEEQYVLRYWETEFEQLRPQKNRAGNRIYVEKDVELLRTIKHLLRDKRFTIDGAKEHLRNFLPETLPNTAVNIAPNTLSSPIEQSLPTDVFYPTPMREITTEGSINAVSELAIEALPGVPVNGQYNEYSLPEIPEENSTPSLLAPTLLASTSVRELSHDELLQMRDTLRELLSLLDSPQGTPNTA